MVGCLGLSACADDITPPGDTEEGTSTSGSSGMAVSSSGASMSETSNGMSSGMADSTSDGSSSTGGSSGDATSSSTGDATSTGDSSGSTGNSTGTSTGTSTGDETTGSTSGTSSDSGSSSDGSESTGPVGTSTGFAETSTGGSSTGFMESSDTGSIPEVCDLFAQECPAGEKCMPYDGEGFGAWTALGCFPIDDNPGQPGDECTVEGSGVSGIDSCDIASQCWDVDPETNTGTCVAMCAGNIDNPICDDPDTGCVIANDELIVLCLPTCDPILQDCPDGLGCYPVDAGFFCAPDGSGTDGAQGDTCTSINGCDPSLMCVDAAAYGPLCGGAACCTAFCDVSDGDTCPIGAQECIGFFAAGMAPPGLEEVGVCAEPA